MARTWLALEIIIIFALLMGQIWTWNHISALALLPILGAAASWYFRGDNLKTLGLQPQPISKNLWLAMGLLFLAIILIIAIVGAIWNPKFFIQAAQGGFWLKYGKSVFGYFFWALLQQLWMCGYFVNRINNVAKNDTKTILITAMLFMIVHLPNPVLIVAGLFGGIFSAYVFLKTRNLYVLALAHAIIGTSLKYFLPHIWHHGLKIGLGF